MRDHDKRKDEEIENKKEEEQGEKGGEADWENIRDQANDTWEDVKDKTEDAVDKVR